jgi:hypothetical protein
MCEPVGRGTLIYAETHRTAANNAIITKERVLNKERVFIKISISALLFARNEFAASSAQTQTRV